MQELLLPIQSGEPARLVPVLKDGSREDRATSVLLGTFRGVPALAKVLLDGIGQRVGVRNTVQCFTQVVLKEPKESTLRPDGLIIVDKPKIPWLAMIEAKIGTASLDKEQILSYVDLAKKNNIDAIITISNDFAALPTHHPIKFSVSEKKKVEIYHWSWLSILTAALLLQESDDIQDSTQRYLLAECIRFFEHDSVGIKGFTQMNPEWKEVVQKVQNGAPLRKQSDEVTNTVAAWHQESRDLCLILSRELTVIVKEKLPIKHGKLPERRMKDDVDQLISTCELRSIFDIPDAASEMTVTASLAKRSLTCSMMLAAPDDKKTNRSQITWILKQLAKTEQNSRAYIRAWPKNSPIPSHATLEGLREDSSIIVPDGKEKVLFSKFEVAVTTDLAGKFSGSKVFIQNIEQLVPEFYASIGQHLRAYIKPAPKPHSKQLETDEQLGLDQHE